MFKKAIVRCPGTNFSSGLTTAQCGKPIFEKALDQHVGYCDALRACGLELTILAADLRFPDSTFVEDTAILTSTAAILCRPGACSREGEVAAIRPEIERFFSNMLQIEAPGTVDGGDICEADGHFFIGLSLRTNEEGCRQLAMHLAALGYTSSVIDVRGIETMLHLKSGIAFIGDHTLVVSEVVAADPLFAEYELIRVHPEENYAANCVRVNERVLVPAGYPRITEELERHGFRPLALEVSEFRKMDGGLSCLSLRF